MWSLNLGARQCGVVRFDCWMLYCREDGDLVGVNWMLYGRGDDGLVGASIFFSIGTKKQKPNGEG